MKYPKKQQGKYAYLEQLTTEELDELRIILRGTPMEMAGRPVRNPTRIWKIIGKL